MDKMEFRAEYRPSPQSDDLTSLAGHWGSQVRVKITKIAHSTQGPVAVVTTHETMHLEPPAPETPTDSEP